MAQYLMMQSEMIFRMILAAICGAVIGYERKSRGKGAGIRTHLVVAAASALMMIISKYGFSDVSSMLYGGISEFKLDPSRLAAQIVSGVGFLGAGMIYIHGKTPHGLTTAAGIWATSGIGMAVGAGMYIIGISATGLIFFAQLILHKNLKLLKVYKTENFTIVIDDDEGALSSLKQLLSENGVKIEDIAVKRLTSSEMELNLSVETDKSFEADDVLKAVKEYKFIKEIRTSGMDF